MIEAIATYIVIGLFLLSLAFAWRADEREKRRNRWKYRRIGKHPLD